MTAHAPRILPDGRAMLNVGCGHRYHPQWTNVDHRPVSDEVIAHDITTGLPFADNSFDVVYHSHVLEHLQPETARSLLLECRRVLKPGGILRIVLPDLEFSARLYIQTLNAAIANPSVVNHEHYEWALLNLIDQMVRVRSGGQMERFLRRETLHDFDFIIENGGGTTVREIRDTDKARQSNPRKKPSWRALRRRVLAWLQGRLLHRNKKSPIEALAQFRMSGEVHQWMYDRYILPRHLEGCGFSDIVQLSERVSRVTGWDQFHLDVDADGRLHKPHSLVFEGCK